MSEHTKEPWSQGDGSRNMIYAWKGQVLVFTDDGYRIIVSCNQNYPEEAEANARRIVACVNACAGMKDPDEEIKNLRRTAKYESDCAGDAYNEVQRLQAQRDELLAEVEEWRAIKAAYLIEYAARPNIFHPSQYHGHAHDIDGIWDSDNGVLAGCQCVACMVHRAAIANAEKNKEGQK